MRVNIDLARLDPSKYRKLAQWLEQLPIKNPVTVTFNKNELLLLAQIFSDAEQLATKEA